MNTNCPLKNLTDCINNLAISKSEKDKEIVFETDAIKAMYYVSKIVFNNLGDVLLFFVSINLLNTYVKQKDSKISYYFKCSIYRLLYNLDNLDSSFIEMDFQRDKNMNVLVIQLLSTQFSFHCLRKETQTLIEKFKHNLEWDKIRKQQCAPSIFKLVEQNTILFTNLSENGKPLLEEAEKLVSNYQNKLIDFYQVKTICRLPEYCFSKKNTIHHLK